MKIGNKSWNWKTAAVVGAVTVVTSVGVCYYACYRIQHRQAILDSSDGNVTDHVVDFIEKALEIKDCGNAYFKGGKYDNALEKYKEALKICPEDKKLERAMLYQNMAVVLDQLGRSDEVLPCLDKALMLFPKYNKALSKRARFYEGEGRYMDALVDATAVATFDNFKTPEFLNRMESLVRKIAEKEVEVILAGDNFTLQSPRSVSSYITSFPNDPLRDKELNLCDDADKSVLKCLELYRAEQYEDCFLQVMTLLSSENTLSEETLIHMRLLRGTFYLLSCREVLALLDLNAVIDSSLSTPLLIVNALIKKAMAVMVSDDTSEAKKCYTEAIRLDPKCADIYYHRGSFYQASELLDEAIRDFSRALQLSPTYSIAAIHKAYNEYEQNKLLESMSLDVFDSLIEEFPHCEECHIIYAQILMIENDLEKATRLCHKLLQEYPNSGPIYMTLATIKLSQDDTAGAMDILQKSVEVDPKYGATYHRLATMSIKVGDLHRAIGLMDEAVKLATNRSRLHNLIATREGMRAQLAVSDNYNINCQDLFAKLARAVDKSDT